MSKKPVRETPAAVAAFETYASMEDRSLEKLAQQMYQRQAKPAPSIPTILTRLKQWSSAHQWQDRLIQREREEAAKLRRKRQKEIERMDEEHALLGRTAAIKAADILRKRMESDDIGAYALVQLFDKATNLERIARGAATQRSEVTGLDGGPIETKHAETEDLTEEDLQLVVELARQVQEQKRGE